MQHQAPEDLPQSPAKRVASDDRVPISLDGLAISWCLSTGCSKKHSDGSREATTCEDHEPIVRFVMLTEDAEYQFWNIRASKFVTDDGDQSELRALIEFSEQSNHGTGSCNTAPQHNYVLKLIDDDPQKPNFLNRYCKRLISKDLADQSIDAAGHPIIACIVATGFA